MEPEDDKDTLEVHLNSTKISRVSPWSRFKVCDDSLYYPGCCAHHDRLSLEEKQFSTRSVSSPLKLRTPNNQKLSTSLGDRTSYFSTGNNPSDKFDTRSLSGQFEFEPEPTLQFSLDESELNSVSDCDEDEDNGMSLVSGSGMDFFRKLVHRSENELPECPASEKSQCLLKRLMEDVDEVSKMDTKVINPEACEADSLSVSSISGSGLAYLGNYLRKKGCPESGRRSDSCSSSECTLADFIDETFDTEESELKILNWDDHDSDCLESDYGSQVFQLDSQVQTPCNILKGKKDDETGTTEKVIIQHQESGLNRMNYINEEERQALIQRVKEIEPVRRLLLASPTFSWSSKSLAQQVASPAQVVDSRGFQPIPSLSHSRTECVRMFIETTKKAAELARIYPHINEGGPTGLPPQLTI